MVDSPLTVQYRAKQLQQQAYGAATRSERLKPEQAAESIYKRCLTVAPKGEATFA